MDSVRGRAERIGGPAGREPLGCAYPGITLRCMWPFLISNCKIRKGNTDLFLKICIYGWLFCSKIIQNILFWTYTVIHWVELKLCKLGYLDGWLLSEELVLSVKKSCFSYMFWYNWLQSDRLHIKVITCKEGYEFIIAANCRAVVFILPSRPQPQLETCSIWHRKGAW